MKRFFTLFSTVFVLLILTACGNKKEVTIDISKLASDLQSSVTSDSLSQTASEMLPSIYFYDEASVEGAAAYASSGSTACEIAVIESKDSKNTSDIEKLLQTRVSSQSELFASYNEGEVKKLDKAIIKSVGRYTVLCVCDDTAKADEILKKYGF